MAAHVVGETLLACEGSPADVTCIRFLSRVDPLMLLQVVFPREALVAILAHEWTVTSVGLNMVCQVIPAREGLATQGADKWLLLFPVPIPLLVPSQ